MIAGTTEVDRSMPAPGIEVETLAEPCLEVVDVLDGFCLVEKRSPILDGSLEARAARGCGPVLEGNAAGFQLRLAEPAVLRRTGEEDVVLQLTDAAHDRVDRAPEALDELLDAGLLEPNGYWHRRLRNGPVQRRGNVLAVWTGLLVRPTPDCWVLQSGARNRRARIEVGEAVILDRPGFVPVVLELDLASMLGPVTWLDSELGCLTPLRPGVRFSICSLDDDPEVGERTNRFYGAQYRDRHAAAKNSGGYHRLMAQAVTATEPGTAESRFVVGGGPNIHRVGTFRRFLDAAGPVRDFQRRGDLQFGVLRNICDIGGHWDGQSFRDLWPEFPPGASGFRRRWARLYGEDQVENIEWVLDYIGEDAPAPIRNEPYLVISSWVFARTPPGWSSIIDGYHQGQIDGMRGVIATDLYHLLAPTQRFYEPCRFTFPRGVPLERVLPVPRELLGAPIRRLAAAEARP